MQKVGVDHASGKDTTGVTIIKNDAHGFMAMGTTLRPDEISHGKLMEECERRGEWLAWAYGNKHHDPMAKRMLTRSWDEADAIWSNANWCMNGQGFITPFLDLVDQIFSAARYGGMLEQFKALERGELQPEDVPGLIKHPGSQLYAGPTPERGDEPTGEEE